jgi:hypothetical protein
MKKTIASILIASTMFSCATIEDNRRAQIISGVLIGVGTAISIAGNSIEVNDFGQCLDSYGSDCDSSINPAIPIGAVITGASFWTLIGTSIKRANLRVRGIEDSQSNDRVCVRSSFSSYDRYYTSTVPCIYPDSIKMQCDTLWLCERRGLL